MIRRVPATGKFRETLAFSRAVAVGNLVQVSATGPTDAQGALVASGAHDQTVEVFRQIGAALESLGLGIADVTRIRIYIKDFAQLPEILRAQYPLFEETPPACTVLCVAAFHVEGMHVYIEAEALRA